MTTNHAVIWIDHQEAHVLFFDPSKNQLIKSHTTHPHLHHKAHEIGSGKAPQDHAFFHQVLAAVADVSEILVVGPSSAKAELLKHAAVHDPAIAKKIVGVETADHPTDGQILAHAKTYFHRVDNMR